VLAAAALVASSASFTAHSTNGNNVFTAGELDLTASNSLGTNGGVILTADNMQPGYNETGYVAVQTTGVGGLVHLTATQASSSTPNLAAKLHIAIQEVADMDGNPLAGGQTVMSDTLMNAMQLSTSLGTWNPGTQTHYYAIHVTWPSDNSTDNNFTGTNTTATFVWDVVSQ
jgi:hypothetical protein